MIIGCDWYPCIWRYSIGYDWWPRVWWCQLDVAGARVCGCGSWMYLMPEVCGHEQLDVIGTHEFGGASLMWFVPAVCGCGSWAWLVALRVRAVAVGFGWRTRIW